MVNGLFTLWQWLFVILTHIKEQNAMTYVIVTDKSTIVGKPVASYQRALREATRLFGDDVRDWIRLNLRVEEATG